MVGALAESQIVKHEIKSILKNYQKFLFKPGSKFTGNALSFQSC